MSAPNPAPADAGDPLQHLLSAARHLAHQAWAMVVAYPLLRLALGAMVLVIVGGWLRRVPLIGTLLRLAGNLGLIAAMLITILQFTHIDSAGLGEALGNLGLDVKPEPSQTVSGGETRIALAPDGHFWVRAQVNGVNRRFLIDTGATLTTLSIASARASHIAPGDRHVRLNTANGTSDATLGRIDTLHVGNIVARRLTVVVAPGLGETNVLGMNFLTQLAGWRVEGKTMVLEPHHPVDQAP